VLNDKDEEIELYSSIECKVRQKHVREQAPTIYLYLYCFINEKSRYWRNRGNEYVLWMFYYFEVLVSFLNVFQLTQIYIGT